MQQTAARHITVERWWRRLRQRLSTECMHKNGCSLSAACCTAAIMLRLCSSNARSATTVWALQAYMQDTTALVGTRAFTIDRTFTWICPHVSSICWPLLLLLLIIIITVESLGDDGSGVCDQLESCQVEADCVAIKLFTNYLKAQKQSRALELVDSMHTEKTLRGMQGMFDTHTHTH